MIRRKTHPFSLWQITAITLLLTFSQPLSAQDILWEKSYGGKHADYLFDVIPTPDYGFILAGSSLSKKTGNKTEDNRGDLDYWIWKMDEKGELDWQKSFGGTGRDLLQCVLLTNDGGFLLGGTTESGKGMDKKDEGKGASDFWIIKLNAKGGEEWQKTLGGSGRDELTTMLRTRDGGFVLGGSSNSPISGDKKQENYGGLDYWVVKIDKTGSVSWQNTFGGIYKDELRSIAFADDSGFILGGSSNSPEGGNKTEKAKGAGDYWLVKINDKGELQSQRGIGGKGDDQLYVVCATTDKGYLLGGNSNSGSGDDKSSSNNNGTDFWVVKLDKDLGMLWQEVYDIGKTDVLTSLIENDDHTILLGGYAQGEVVKSKGMGSRLRGNDKGKKDAISNVKMKQGTDDYVAIKINEKGEELWRKDVGSEGQDILKKVIETRDGGYLMAGTSKNVLTADGGMKATGDKSSGIGSTDFWVVKLKDKDKPKEAKKPVEAIPNPAIDYTNIIIGYDFTKGIATVVDLAGRVLQQFAITDRTIPIDLQGLPEGIYVVNVKTDKGSDGVKVIKQRKR